jgi:hypothetical protein
MPSSRQPAASLLSLLPLLLLGAPALARGGEEHHDHAARAEAAPSPAQARLARLKALAGTWTGKASHGDGAPMDATVIWGVTGGGTAVTETIFPGTAHEMMSVYTVDGDDLVLTHYCAAGNQPSMKAAPGADARSIAFDFTHGANMKVADHHMHSAVITFVAEDRLESEWTSWTGGKAGGAAHFTLARQKAPAAR